jgi:hypothetical protein
MLNFKGSLTLVYPYNARLSKLPTIGILAQRPYKIVKFKIEEVIMRISFEEEDAHH